MSLTTVSSGSKDPARRILAQLGGHEFIAMTGAKYLTGTGGGLDFHLPRGVAKDAISRVRIEVSPCGGYHLEFGMVGADGYVKCADFSEIGEESIREVFTEATGLATRCWCPCSDGEDHAVSLKVG
jgi:hypothetical protein